MMYVCMILMGDPWVQFWPDWNKTRAVRIESIVAISEFRGNTSVHTVGDSSHLVPDVKIEQVQAALEDCHAQAS